MINRRRQFRYLLQKVRTPSNFVRHVTSTFAVQVAVLITATFNTAIIARWLGAEGKGVIQLALLIPSMFGLFLSSGIGVANVHYAGTRRYNVAQLMGNTVTYTLLLTVVGVLLFWLIVAMQWLDRLFPGVPFWLLMIAMAAFPMALLQGYLNAILQGIQAIFTLNLISLISAIASSVLTVIWILWLKQGAAGALYASIVTNMLTLVLQCIVLYRRGGTLRPRWDRQIMRDTLRFGLRGHVGNVLQFFNYRLDVFIVNYFLGPASVGLYGVGTKLAELVWYFPNAVGFVIFPKASASTAREMNRFTPRIFKLTLVLSVCAGLGLALIGRPFIEIVYTSAFVSAYLPMLALLPGVVLLGSGRVLTNDIAGRGYPQYNSLNSALALVLTIIFDLLLIPRMGILGAGIASSIAYTLTFVSALIFYRIVSRRAETEPKPPTPVVV